MTLHLTGGCKLSSLGQRREDTAYLASSIGTVRSPNRESSSPWRAGTRSPGHFISRKGAGYQAWASGGTHPGNELFSSIVGGYRPKAWQTEYPRPDFRLLLELVGELQERGQRSGQPLIDTGGHRLALAPGVLGTYRNWDFSFGVAFPVIQDLKGHQPRERLRFGVDVTDFF